MDKDSDDDGGLVFNADGTVSSSLEDPPALSPPRPAQPPPALEGALHKKGGAPGWRVWKLRWVQLAGAELAWYRHRGDKAPTRRFAIDARTVVAPGDPARVHKNARVRWDFDVTNAAKATVAFYCESEDERARWMNAVQLVVARFVEALGESALPSPPLPPRHGEDVGVDVDALNGAAKAVDPLVDR